MPQDRLAGEKISQLGEGVSIFAMVRPALTTATPGRRHMPPAITYQAARSLPHSICFMKNVRCINPGASAGGRLDRMLGQGLCCLEGSDPPLTPLSRQHETCSCISLSLSFSPLPLGGVTITSSSAATVLSPVSTTHPKHLV
ncbi:hypothetical protein Pmani_029292 [Petrolisthes manimaculis]|uniref:Uncharacterized protein n=1 Tax=Petrolisthes manimaculis TaxID=1843537 RepID=A0AAE1P0B5_9EUCA|nr:hypothetical protein Pmani_029292 [Petrolisthes manimaculis]